MIRAIPLLALLILASAVSSITTFYATGGSVLAMTILAAANWRLGVLCSRASFTGSNA